MPFPDGSYEAEVYVPVTEDELLIESVTPDGLRKTMTTESIMVAETDKRPYFLALLGDMELGRNSTSGNLEAVKHNPRFKDGSYNQGRLAYFFRGTFGKWQIKSSFDMLDGFIERYRKSKGYTDKLEQSILTKAFRGELVLQANS